MHWPSTPAQHASTQHASAQHARHTRSAQHTRSVQHALGPAHISPQQPGTHSRACIGLRQLVLGKLVLRQLVLAQCHASAQGDSSGPELKARRALQPSSAWSVISSLQVPRWLLQRWLPRSAVARVRAGACLVTSAAARAASASPPSGSSLPQRAQAPSRGLRPAQEVW